MELLVRVRELTALASSFPSAVMDEKVLAAKRAAVEELFLEGVFLRKDQLLVTCSTCGTDFEAEEKKKLNPRLYLHFRGSQHRASLKQSVKDGKGSKKMASYGEKLN